MSLHRRVHYAEVEKERSERKAWEEAMERWRNLRTDHTVNLFRKRIQSAEFADPPARRGLMQSLAEEQTAAHTKLIEQLEASEARRCKLTLD